MPHAFLHSLNVGTLATWLSVAGFGTVGVVAPPWHRENAPSPVEETRLIDEDFTLGDAGSPAVPDEAAEANPAASPQNLLPAPPELPPLAETAPLPEIPIAENPLATQPEASPSPSRVQSQPRASTARAAGPSAGKPSPTRADGISKLGGTAAGMSDSVRLSKGRMPSPSYPAESRRKGQTGTVIIEFTVDASGHVIAAFAKSPSPWPLLNHEAVRTVRRWKFPPGGVMKLQRPIVFQLR